jgi:uncharacterized protein YuzE
MENAGMRVTYDTEVNAAYIYLKDIAPGEARHQVGVQDPTPRGQVILDFDAEGTLIGIEVLDAKEGLPQELLDQAERR